MNKSLQRITAACMLLLMFGGFAEELPLETPASELPEETVQEQPAAEEMLPDWNDMPCAVDVPLVSPEEEAEAAPEASPAPEETETPSEEEAPAELPEETPVPEVPEESAAPEADETPVPENTEIPAEAEAEEETEFIVLEADWETSDIQSVFACGVVAKVTDVRTGISWNVVRKSGTFHADVQPCTTTDTYEMKRACRSFSWKRRAIWVTIGDTTYAASMVSQPHGQDSVSGNSYDGHFCIHFTNSRTHGSEKVDSNHQAKIQEALEAAKKKQ